MFQSHSFYIPGKGILYELHPFTKLSGLLTISFAVFLGIGGIWSSIIIGLFILLLAVWTGLIRPLVWTCLKMVFPLFLMLGLIHGLFYPSNTTLLLSLGPLHVGKEGLEFALLIVIRVTVFLFSSLLVLFSTSLANLTRAFSQSGMPSGLVYLLSSPLLLLPQITAKVETISQAQQSRGMETKGSIINRIKALYPLVAPLVLGVFLESEDRAIALETRKFDVTGTRTSLYQLQDSRFQRILRKTLIITNIALVIFVITGQLLSK
jgi:energy-coupling factor transport system permease protein